MLKIGDFSRLCRISVKTLRYYDEIGLLKPVSVDQFSGYRYYSIDQMDRLNRIIVLKNLGLSLEEIAVIINTDPSVEHIRQLLRVKQEEIRQRLTEDRQRFEQVERWLIQIEKEGSMPDADVILKKIEKQKVASLRRKIPAYSKLDLMFEELMPYIFQNKGQIVGPPVVVLHDKEYQEKAPDVELAFPVAGDIKNSDRIKIYDLPEIAQAACYIHKGAYEHENYQKSYGAIMKWIDKNGYEVIGPNREVYLVSEPQVKDPAAYITEIQFPVTKK